MSDKVPGTSRAGKARRANVGWLSPSRLTDHENETRDLGETPADGAGAILAELLAVKPGDRSAYASLLDHLHDVGLRPEAATDLDAQRAQVAAELVSKVVLALLSPTAERWESIERAHSIVTEKTDAVMERLARVVLVVKLWRRHPDINPGDIHEGREQLHADLVQAVLEELFEIDDRFGNLDPWRVAEVLWMREKPSKKPAPLCDEHLAAHLSLSAGAFGHERKVESKAGRAVKERVAEATERVQGYYKQAWTRHKFQIAQELWEREDPGGYHRYEAVEAIALEAGVIPDAATQERDEIALAKSWSKGAKTPVI